MLDAKALAKSFGERVIFEPFDLEIRHGEAVGLVGANGSGKTTLFRIIRGEELPSSGMLRLGPSVVVGYYAQEQETLDPASTAMDVVRALKPMSEQGAIGFLNRYLFTREDMLGRIGGLSGGQRARLQIAALILQGANFLLLDEPTNNLDIPSVERLEGALLAFLTKGKGRSSLSRTTAPFSTRSAAGSSNWTGGVCAITPAVLPGTTNIAAKDES